LKLNCVCLIIAYNIVIGETISTEGKDISELCSMFLKESKTQKKTWKNQKKKYRDKSDPKFGIEE
jgi:hypothetical protein